MMRNELLAFIVFLFGMIFYLIPFVYFVNDAELSLKYSESYLLLTSVFIANLVIFLGVLRLSRKYLLADIRDRIKTTRIPPLFKLRDGMVICFSLMAWFFLDVFLSESLLDVSSRGEFLLENYNDRLETGGFSFVTKILKVLLFVTILDIYAHGKKRLAYLLFVIISLLEIVLIVKTSTHRSPIIFIFASIFFAYLVFLKKVRIYSYILIVGMLILPIYFSAAAMMRAGLDINLSDSYSKILTHGYTGLYTVSEIPVLKDALSSGRVEYEYGKQLIYTLLTPIPRVVWSNKPNVSFSSRKTIEIYGAIRPGNWVRTFTLFGEGYAQFGYLGVILYGVIFVAFLNFVFFVLSKHIYVILPMLKYLASFPLFVRADLFSFVGAMLPILIVLLGLKLLTGIERR
ncbi:hypothetical protein PSI9734_01628 [Pseudidiomarina piscicola]|uniref:Oligosaccharide repeat unit polymerase n=1 Tax=Pseudidiomarina piscicola TaxID=2614830 RepID=A0A6S6WMZ8_9GAMM|nr:O-antigen polymerase [Pseudidiomarina piscicola]CAB0151215.1 hypothetical protein PSI9734_01628 [Pseudidiomarina piscicola]VZT40721.1 hypothetical protein PSI9734_01628 [Pseudomonas aeruginosa]